MKIFTDGRLTTVSAVSHCVTPFSLFCAHWDSNCLNMRMFKLFVNVCVSHITVRPHRNEILSDFGELSVLILQTHVVTVGSTSLYSL
jgi:hypothetical protein